MAISERLLKIQAESDRIYALNLKCRCNNRAIDKCDKCNHVVCDDCMVEAVLNFDDTNPPVVMVCDKCVKEGN